MSPTYWNLQRYSSKGDKMLGELIRTHFCKRGRVENSWGPAKPYTAHYLPAGVKKMYGDLKRRGSSLPKETWYVLNPNHDMIFKLARAEARYAEEEAKEKEWRLTLRAGYNARWR